MLASASILDAADAFRMGLFDAVCPSEYFDEWFEQTLRTFTVNPPQVMRAYKASLGRMRAREEIDALETEHFANVWVHEDHWSAVEQLQGSKS